MAWLGSEGRCGTTGPPVIILHGSQSGVGPDLGYAKLRYQPPIAQRRDPSDPAAMTMKRVVAAILWVYACWAAGGLAEFLFGTPALLGLAVGIAAAVFFGLDPLGVVWPKAEEESVHPGHSPSVETPHAVGSAVSE
jgi:hypothetical protein